MLDEDYMTEEDDTVEDEFLNGPAGGKKARAGI